MPRLLRRVTRRLSGRDYTTAITVAIVAAVGIGFTLAGISERRAQQPIEGGIVTTGRIVGTVSREYRDDRGTHTNEFPIIEFRDRHEQSHRFESRVMGGKKGDRVEVRYDPDDPSRAQWADAPGTWLWMVFVSIGPICLLIGVGIVVRSRSKARSGDRAGSQDEAVSTSSLPLADPRPAAGDGEARTAGAIFTQQVLFVIQTWPGGPAQPWPSYELFDRQWQPLGVARRPGPEGPLQVLDVAGTLLLETEDDQEDGRPVVRIRNGQGQNIGKVIRMRGVLRPELDLEHDGRRIGSVKVPDRRQRVVDVYDEVGTEVAEMRTVTEETSVGVPEGTEGYYLQTHQPLQDPLRSLVVACAVIFQSFITTESRDASLSITFPGISALLDRFRRKSRA